VCLYDLVVFVWFIDNVSDLSKKVGFSPLLMYLYELT
jgi:hypothetical protein